MVNQSSKLLLAVLGTVCAAWLAARVTHPALPVSRQVQAVSSPASWSEGVSYAETISRPEQSPRMSALDLPRGDAEFKLPWAPTRAWAQHRLCQADVQLLARVSQLPDSEWETWSAMSEGCEESSRLCARAQAAADAGTPTSRLERQLFPSVLSGCSPESLSNWLDAGWLPLGARATWSERFGSKEFVDDALLRAIENDTDGGTALSVLSALVGAPHDDSAARRLIAVHRKGGPNARWLAHALASFETASAQQYLGSLCASQDAGWCRHAPTIPTDLVELAAALSEARVHPWMLLSRDGGAVPASTCEALATCSLSGKPSSNDCLRALTAADWAMAHGVAKRLSIPEAALLSRFPQQRDFEAALSRCAVDAGPRPSPFEVAELSGRPSWPTLDALWQSSGAALAEVPVQERAASLAADSTTLSAWSHGQRIDVVLPQGCNPPTHEAAVGLANVVLQAEGSPQRFYALRDGWRGSVSPFLMDQATAGCLFDGGLLQPLPASQMAEMP